MSLGPDARALLDAASDGDAPSADDRDRVRAKLAARLALGVAAGAAATTATKTAAGAGAAVPMTSLLGVKLGAVLLLVGSAAATTAYVVHERQPVATTTQGAPGQANVGPANVGDTTSGAANLPPSPGAGDPGSASPADTTVAARANVAGEANVAPSALGATTSAAGRANVSPAAPSAPGGTTSVVGNVGPTSAANGAVGRANVSPPPAAVPTAGQANVSPAAAVGTAPAAGANVGPSAATATSAPPPRDSVAEEAALLRAANAALARGDGATALARVDEHAARFPHGALTEEREAARVFALCAAGRVADSRAAATAFVSARPRSQFVAQVRRTCTTAP